MTQVTPILPQSSLLSWLVGHFCLADLVVVAGRPYEPSAEDLAQLLQQQQRSIVKRVTLPTKTRNLPPQTSAGSPTPEAASVPDVTEASANSSDRSPTSGKMEVVVKLNQFPDDVKTIDNGWKEFVVDTGDSIVTITVKPKMFAILEQAHQAYPSWVAAISGHMGEMTLTGFRLESPSIKVFERKAKDSFDSAEQTTTSDNRSPSLATEPTVPTLPQQQVTQPKPESPQQPVPTKNPTQRVKEQILQQRPTKTPPHQNLYQQRDQTSPG